MIYLCCHVNHEHKQDDKHSEQNIAHYKSNAK